MQIKCTILCTRLALGIAALASVSLTSTPVLAQSAADKATARNLATAGIKLYQQHKYEEALDKLKRAQEMYDAPVHLLYMARCYVKLNKLVEGAESYRRLVRTELAANSPDVFQTAVADGEKELAEVEPRIPSLTINVTPSDVSGLRIVLDGEEVSAAVVGVERPVNPGERTVMAEAPGYLSVETSVTVNEGQSERVSLTLEVDPNAPKEPPPGEVQSAGQGGTAPPPAVPGEEDWRTKEISMSAVGAFIGLRVGGLFPAGSLVDGASTADYVGVGGGAELHGGVRFLRNFGVKIFYERYALQPGPRLDAAPPPLEGSAFEVKSTPYATSLGFSALAGTQRGRLGGYGEIGLALMHEYGWDRQVSDIDVSQLPSFNECNQTEAYKGAAFRLGGAFVLPVHENIQLTAVAVFTLSNFGKLKTTSNCVYQVENSDGGIEEIREPGETETDIAEQGLHQQFFLGVGADFMFGPG